MFILRGFSMTLLLWALPLSAGHREGRKPVAANNVQERGEAELLALHRANRRAHFEHDVQALVSEVAPDLVDVRDGEINHRSPEDMRRNFTEYFQKAKFSAWDDAEPPVVRVSPDGQMGWMIVRVHIAYTATDAGGKKTNRDSMEAWMAAYERRAGKWVMVAVTSTSSEK